MEIRALRRCGGAVRAGRARRPPSRRPRAHRGRTGPGPRRRRSGGWGGRSRRDGAARAHRRWRPCSTACRRAPPVLRPRPAAVGDRSPRWAVELVDTRTARSSTTATASHLPSVIERAFDCAIATVGHDPRRGQLPRRRTSLATANARRCWRDRKPALFMNLWMECGYLRSPVLNRWGEPVDGRRRQPHPR